MKIGIIGAGRIGRALAMRFAGVGHEVMLSNSRGPNTLRDVVASVEGNVGAGTVEDAARFGDIDAVAIPTPGIRDLTPEPFEVAHPAHLNARDTTLAFASRAPEAEIQGLKKRMGWELIPWYTITDDFDADFDVDEWQGHNAFIRQGDRIAPTTSTAAAPSKSAAPGATST